MSTPENVNYVRSAIHTDGGIRKSLLTPCRRLGLSRKTKSANKLQKSASSPSCSPLNNTDDTTISNITPETSKSVKSISQTSGSVTKTVWTPCRRLGLSRKKSVKQNQSFNLSPINTTISSTPPQVVSEPSKNTPIKLDNLKSESVTPLKELQQDCELTVTPKISVTDKLECKDIKNSLKRKSDVYEGEDVDCSENKKKTKTVDVDFVKNELKTKVKGDSKNHELEDSKEHRKKKKKERHKKDKLSDKSRKSSVPNLVKEYCRDEFEDFSRKVIESNLQGSNSKEVGTKNNHPAASETEENNPAGEIEKNNPAEQVTIKLKRQSLTSDWEINKEDKTLESNFGGKDCDNKRQEKLLRPVASKEANIKNPEKELCLKNTNLNVDVKSLDSTPIKTDEDKHLTIEGKSKENNLKTKERRSDSCKINLSGHPNTSNSAPITTIADKIVGKSKPFKKSLSLKRSITSTSSFDSDDLETASPEKLLSKRPAIPEIISLDMSIEELDPKGEDFDLKLKGNEKQSVHDLDKLLFDVTLSQGSSTSAASCHLLKDSDVDDFQSSSSMETRIKQLEKTVKEKKAVLEDLKRADMYHKKHSVEELRKLTNVWKKGCQEALTDLLPKLKEHGNIEMGGLLKNLNIPIDVIGYSAKQDSFS